MLAGVRVVAQITQRRLGGATSATTPVLGLGEQLLGLVNVHGEDLIFGAQRTGIRPAVGARLGQIRTIATVVGGHRAFGNLTGLGVGFLVLAHLARQAQQLQRIFQRERFGAHGLEQRGHPRTRRSGRGLLGALLAGRRSGGGIGGTLRWHQRHIRPEPTVAHFHGAAGNRVLAQLARATGMVVGQIMSHFDGQLVRRDGVRQGGTLRVAFGIQMLHIFQIRAVPANAHMQAVADVNGVDGSGVDLAKLCHLLLQAFMRFVGIAGRALAGAKVEVGQPIPASLLAVSNAIEAVFHLSGERVIDQLGEVRFQQLGHGECQPAGDQRTATLIHIAAIHNRGDDAGIGGRAADLLGFQRLDQRGFGVSSRRLGFVAIRLDVGSLDPLAHLHRR